jgi:hypothetical protein
VGDGELLHASFAAGELELISELLSRIFGSGMRPVLRVAVDGPDMPVVRWHALTPHSATFEFSAWFFQNHSTWMPLFPWIRSISLFGAYHRSVCFVPGEVNYSCDDAGILPGLAQCSNKPEHFLVPDSSFLHTRGYAVWRRHFSNGPAWAEREPVAFWRGGTTGAWDKKDWRALPRIRLCELARQSEELIDAGITSVVQMPEGAADEIRSSGLIKDHVDPVYFIKYKYQLDIDGNTNSWPGLFQKLLSGSPVLKVESPFGYRQWYYDRLRPWWNFVPVKSDMSDLVSRVEWLQVHDDWARRIGERGRELALSLEHEAEARQAAETIAAAMMAESALTRRAGARGPLPQAGEACV